MPARPVLQFFERRREFAVKLRVGRLQSKERRPALERRPLLHAAFADQPSEYLLQQRR